MMTVRKRSARGKPDVVALYYPFMAAVAFGPAAGLALAIWNSWKLNCPDRQMHLALAVAAALSAFLLVHHSLDYDAVFSASPEMQGIRIAERFKLLGILTLSMAALAFITERQMPAFRFRAANGRPVDLRIATLLKIGAVTCLAAAFLRFYVPLDISTDMSRLFVWYIP